MRRVLAIAAVIMTAFLSGCSDITELGNRAIIQALALDYDGEIYRASALLFSSSGSGGDTIDASQENVIKVCGEGTTLTAAIDDISLTDGKEIYLCETKLLILGGGFEYADADRALDILYNDMRCSLNMPVCCADKAEMLTELRFTEGLTSAEKPLSIIENACKSGLVPKTTLLDTLTQAAGGQPVLIPHFTETDNGSDVTSDDSGRTAVLDGTRLLSGSHLGKFSDMEQTLAFMLISGQTDSVTLSYLHGGGEETCVAYGISVRPVETDGGSALRVTAHFRGRSGGALSASQQQSALKRLTEIIRSGS